MAVVACLKKADARLILIPQLKQNAPPSHDGLENTALSAWKFIDKVRQRGIRHCNKSIVALQYFSTTFWHVRI